MWTVWGSPRVRVWVDPPGSSTWTTPVAGLRSEAGTKMWAGSATRASKAFNKARPFKCWVHSSSWESSQVEKVTRAAFHDFWRARSQRAKGGRRESGLESKWRRAIGVSSWEEMASKPTGKTPGKSMGEGWLLREGRMVETVEWTGAGGEETRRGLSGRVEGSGKGLRCRLGLELEPFCRL